MRTYGRAVACTHQANQTRISQADVSYLFEDLSVLLHGLVESLQVTNAHGLKENASVTTARLPTANNMSYAKP